MLNFVKPACVLVGGSYGAEEAEWTAVPLKSEGTCSNSRRSVYANLYC